MKDRYFSIPFDEYKTLAIDMKKRILLILTLSFIILKSWSQDFKNYRSPQDWVVGKNYYATFLLWKNPALLKTLEAEPTLKQLITERNVRFKQTQQSKTVPEIISGFKWSTADLNRLEVALNKVYKSNPNIQVLVKDILIPSKKYALLQSNEPASFFVNSILQDAKAANYVIDVYAGGQAPNYKRTDSISFDVRKNSYIALLQDIRQDVEKDMQNQVDPFFTTMLTAVRALEINERWDTAQLEPLQVTENKATLARIAKTDFNSYPYVMLLTLGAGPQVYDQAISPGGMLRCRQAARTYFEGKAPFIMVSGGRVHPFKTPYIEALEMKKYLVGVLNVPADVILIDPHARHTTTNLRNASRIMLSTGFPKGKSAIINSSKTHIDAVELMGPRCMKELGYIPYKLGKRTSEVIIEFLPDENAFIIDWDEPLDP